MEMEMGTGTPGPWLVLVHGGDASFSSSCVAFMVVAMEGEASL